ncbi:MAG: TetR/AcrR family transcriptional regulator C-terminal domain-containing protein [Bacillus sp. (in: Bacteria)]|nr:TetR/AcrR family transcriptional regulator C-terminal domain-containing protein [Bacillus sp. (in: firmicutes)]MCM1425933.1 TetR/AcrR family transcriptional regulator C-terminal domain-containing protein [Eubacterium sp.]
MQHRTNVDKLLAESFKELARKTPIDKITIQEITDKAGVIRPTFYHHFQDKYVLLDWIIQKEILDPVIPLLEEGDLREGLILIFTNLQKDKDFYTRVVRLEGQNSCESITRKFIKEILFTFIDEKAGHKIAARKGLTIDMIAEYFAQSATFIVINWLKMNMSLTPVQMADIFQYITSHSMDDIIAEMR